MIPTTSLKKELIKNGKQNAHQTLWSLCITFLQFQEGEFM